MKRIASLVLAFAAMLLLTARASACVSDGDTEGYVLAFVCGVFVFAIAILAAWVSLQWEMELQSRHKATATLTLCAPAAWEFEVGDFVQIKGSTAGDSDGIWEVAALPNATTVAVQRTKPEAICTQSSSTI